MPWRSFPEWLAHAPDWVQWAMASLTGVIAAGVGVMSKIADDVKRGHRDQFWTAKLLLEIPTVFMMALVGWGVSEFYGLSYGQSAGITTTLGWVGPKALDTALARWLPGRSK